MLIPAQRVLQGLNAEFARLQSLFGDSNVDGSAALSITVNLQTLLNREFGGAAAVRAQIEQLDGVLEKIGTLTTAAPAIHKELGALRAALRDIKPHAVLTDLEDGLRQVLARLQVLTTQLIAAPGIDAATKNSIAQLLVAWEAGDLQKQAAAGHANEAVTTGVEITRDNLTVYLRDRFAEPDLKITTFQPLAGGFGKQTIMFEAQGRALNGAFVMRRDLSGVPMLDNDCHRIRDEYPVLKAAHARGFPAPDALWLDVEHELLPGGDFIVMRRAPGKVPGNYFGARTAVPSGLTDALADIMARLHTLPPLTELGNHTDSINLEWWKLSKRECTERYIRGWYELYLRAENTPSPSVVALFGWLLDNLPDRDGPPSLLHGDFGFHNFLFHEDKLSAALDWEFAHIGDPAEELGSVRVTTGASIDWERLMARYIAGGGETVDAKTLRYFRVWALARNAAASNLAGTIFIRGHADELKLAFLPYIHFPNFIRGAQALIDGAD